MKNTGQKINALDDMNNLINGITNMSKREYFIIKITFILAIMKDLLKPQVDDDDKDVYG
jgi:hypothetical protein